MICGGEEGRASRRVCGIHRPARHGLALQLMLPRASCWSCLKWSAMSAQVHTMPAGGKPRLLAKQPQQPTLTDLQYLVQVRFASSIAQRHPSSHRLSPFDGGTMFSQCFVEVSLSLL